MSELSQVVRVREINQQTSSQLCDFHSGKFMLVYLSTILMGLREIQRLDVSISHTSNKSCKENRLGIQDCGAAQFSTEQQLCGGGQQ